MCNSCKKLGTDEQVTEFNSILEKNKGTEDVVIVGVIRRGSDIADRIALEIEKIDGVKVPVGSIDISFLRDDICHSENSPVVNDTNIPFDISGKNVILTDDVIYTGRTVRAAIDALFRLGRPKTVQLAVLIDRGLRELPIKPDYVGKNIPTSHSEFVEVKLEETDGEDAVSIKEK